MLPLKGEPEQMLSGALNRLEMMPKRQLAADEARRPVKRTDAIPALVRDDKGGREGMCGAASLLTLLVLTHPTPGLLVSSPCV